MSSKRNFDELRAAAVDDPDAESTQLLVRAARADFDERVRLCRSRFGWVPALCAGGLMVSIGALVLGPSSLCCVLALLVPLAIGGVLDARRLRIVRSGMDRQRCPACAFDLRGLPDDIPHEIAGRSYGPARCPECGARWPCVPEPSVQHGAGD